MVLQDVDKAGIFDGDGKNKIMGYTAASGATAGKFALLATTNYAD